MPLPICSIASVMMKDGNADAREPERVDETEREAGHDRKDDRRQPGSGMLAIFVLASCSVK